jgi:hypothetical protein
MGPTTAPLGSTHGHGPTMRMRLGHDSWTDGYGRCHSGIWSRSADQNIANTGLRACSLERPLGQMRPFGAARARTVGLGWLAAVAVPQSQRPDCAHCRRPRQQGGSRKQTPFQGGSFGDHVGSGHARRAAELLTCANSGLSRRFRAVVVRAAVGTATRAKSALFL